jgi:hypothetical protein
VRPLLGSHLLDAVSPAWMIPPGWPRWGHGLGEHEESLGMDPLPAEPLLPLLVQPGLSLNEPLIFCPAFQMHYIIIPFKYPTTDIINPIFQITIVATPYWLSLGRRPCANVFNLSSHCLLITAC